MPTHDNLPLISCWMERSYTQNMTILDQDDLIQVEIFGIASYPGREPLFHARIKENGAIFSSLPIDAFRRKNKELHPRYSSKELIYHLAPDDNVSVVEFNALKQPANAWLQIGVTRELSRSHNVTYICTLDWPKTNYLQHLVCLDQYQYALIPNHKILFSSHGELPIYKKLRASFGYR